MALKHTMIFGALLISVALTEMANGQVNTPSPRFGPKALESAEATRPFATPGVFDYDAQVFTPLEFTNGKQKAPNTGFYFTLDKTYTSISNAGYIGRSDSGIQTGTNYIWGTRYEFGWFADTDDGWGIAYQNANGIYYTAGQDATVGNPMLVDSTLSTFEINRIFRQTLSNGGYFEPYLGIRYMNMSDNTIEDTTQIVGAVTLFNRFKQNTTNDAFGFQVGGRYNNRRGRWRTTTDGLIATMYNQQRYFATDITNTGAGAQGISEAYQSDQSFIPVIQGQYEIAYNVSRDISLRGGVQVMYAWNGVARANTLTTNLNSNSVFGTGNDIGLFDDNLLSAGFLFGVEWRR